MSKLMCQLSACVFLWSTMCLPYHDRHHQQQGYTV